MNVYLRELKMTRNGMVGWIIVLVLVTLLFMSIFPAFSSDADASHKVIEGFPVQVREVIGLNVDAFFSFLGYYAYVLTYVGLAGAVQAMNLGLIMLSREAASKTSDFLLTKPITRTKIFISKLLAALTVLIITNVALVIATLIMTVIFSAGNFSLRTFGLLSLAFFLVQLMFLSIGILVSQIIRVKSVISVSLGMVFGFFAIGMLQALTNDKDLRYFTPFKYFDHMQIVSTGMFEATFIWLTAAVIIVPTATSYIIYKVRDLKSAL